MAAGPKKQGARPNDATGRKRDELAKQQAEEQKRREGELTTITAQREIEADDGVYDPKSGVLLNEDEVVQKFLAAQSATLAPGTRQPGHTDAEVDPKGVMYVKGQEETPVQTNDTAIIGRGPESPFEVVGGTPADELMRDVVDTQNPPARQAIDLGTQEVGQQEKSVVIRVNEDLQQVTIGVGNHYDFEAGRQYRVPAHVAAHLEEKGYIWH